MITIRPSDTFEATTKAFAHLATVGVRIRDNAGNDFLARTTSGVTEDLNVGTNAVFRRNFTAPSSAGQWTIVWDDGTTLDIEELVVTAGSAAIQAVNDLYVTRDEIKTAQTLGGQSFADDDIDRAIAAASRAIDNATRRFFYSADQTRYYTPDRCDNELVTGDIQAITTLALDWAGDGSFSTTLVQDTDYHLEPYNAALIDEPYTAVRLTPGRSWPSGRRTVQIIGTFGWASVPNDVNQYAAILATKLLLRTRQAPFGVLSYGLDQPIATRITRIDPDFELLLGHYVQSRLFV